MYLGILNQFVCIYGMLIWVFVFVEIDNFYCFYNQYILKVLYNFYIFIIIYDIIYVYIDIDIKLNIIIDRFIILFVRLERLFYLL